MKLRDSSPKRLRQRLAALRQTLAYREDAAGKPCGKSYISAKRKCSKKNTLYAQRNRVEDVKKAAQKRQAERRLKQYAKEGLTRTEIAEREAKRKIKQVREGDTISSKIPGWGEVKGRVISVDKQYGQSVIEITESSQTNKRSRTRFDPGERQVIPNEWVTKHESSRGRSVATSAKVPSGGQPPGDAKLISAYDQRHGRNSDRVTAKQIRKMATSPLIDQLKEKGESGKVIEEFKKYGKDTGDKFPIDSRTNHTFNFGPLGQEVLNNRQAARQALLDAGDRPSGSPTKAQASAKTERGGRPQLISEESAIADKLTSRDAEKLLRQASRIHPKDLKRGQEFKMATFSFVGAEYGGAQVYSPATTFKVTSVRPSKITFKPTTPNAGGLRPSQSLSFDQRGWGGGVLFSASTKNPAEVVMVENGRKATAKMAQQRQEYEREQDHARHVSARYQYQTSLAIAKQAERALERVKASDIQNRIANARIQFGRDRAATAGGVSIE